MIQFSQVSKHFGSVRALDHFQTDIPAGRVIGLFGPNGAGKSTTLKMIAGLNRPDSGEVRVDGLNPWSTRDRVAYLPEIDHLYPWMTINEAHRFMRSFYRDWDEEQYRSLLTYLNLDESMKVGKISKGQRAKAKLLLTREEIINTIIHDYREGEQTVIISTHEIDEVESLVDEVIFIDQGRIVLSGNAEDLREEKSMSLVEMMKEVMRSGR